MDVATYLKRSKKTQAALARELDTSRSVVCDLVKGRRRPGKKTAMKLEAITGHPWWQWVGEA
jgi:plasmid maintenance system antidote protein VapI